MYSHSHRSKLTGFTVDLLPREAKVMLGARAPLPGACSRRADGQEAMATPAGLKCREPPVLLSKDGHAPLPTVRPHNLSTLLLCLSLSLFGIQVAVGEVTSDVLNCSS